MTTMDPQAIKQLQHETWNSAAAGWKKNDERLQETTRPVTERLLKLAGMGPGKRLLDIACGTGQPGLSGAEMAGPDGFALLTDMSEEMLAVAREKAAARGLTNVELRAVDGETLDVEPGSFDAVTCRWGIMFMPEPVRCLKHALAALKPGGRMAAAVWGPPPRNPFLSLPMGVIMRHTQVPPPDPNAPGIFAFADRAKLSGAFSEAGFRDVEVEDLELTMVNFPSGREYWAYTLEIAGPIAQIVQKLPAETQALIAEEVAKTAGGGDPDAPVSLSGLAILGSGTK